MCPWCVKMPTQNLLRLLLLLVDDEDGVGNSLLQIWELRFGHKAKLLFIYFEHKVWSRFWSWSSGKIFVVKRFSALEKSWLSCRHWLPLSLTPPLISLQLLTRCWCLVEILMLWSRFVFEFVLWRIRLLIVVKTRGRCLCYFQACCALFFCRCIRKYFCIFAVKLDKYDDLIETL